MRFLFGGFLFVSFFLARAQQHYFFKPDNLKQLPSSETYNILQDHLGYIWFSTDAGLCRFNGNSLRVYSAKEGLPELSTYTVFEDNEGRLWVTTAENRVLVYEPSKDIFSEAAFSKNCRQSCKSLGQIYLARAVGNEIWLCTQYMTFKADRTDKQVRHILAPDSSAYYFQLNEGALLPVKAHLSRKMTAQVRNTGIIPIVFETGSRQLRMTVSFKKNHSPDTRVLTSVNKKGVCYIAFNEYLLKIDTALNWEVKKLDHVILNLYSDPDDHLWVGTYKGGVSYFSGDLKSQPVIDLPNLSVTGVFEDAEKNIWCTTLEKGVFCCRSKLVLDYTPIIGADKNIEFLASWGNRVFAGVESNSIFEFRNNKVRKITLEKTSELGLADIVPYENGWLLANRSYTMKLDSQFSNQKVVFEKASRALSGASQLARVGNRVFGIQRGTLLSYTGTVASICSDTMNSPVAHVWYWPRVGLLVGGKDGLLSVDTGNFSQKKISGIEGNVTRVFAADETLYITTQNKGVYVIKNNQVSKLEEQLSIPACRYSDMIEDQKHTLWFATNRGLLKVEKPYSKTSWKFFTTLHGLPSNEVLQIVAADENIFVSTSEGLSRLPITANLTNTFPPPLYVRSFLVDQKEIVFTADSSLSYDQNDIRIIFDVLTYKQNGTWTKIHYTIDGPYHQALNTDGREIVLNNLQPGVYRLRAYAVNADKTRSAYPVSLRFEIQKPFWLSYWFIAALVLVLAGIIYLVVRRIIARIARKEQEKTRVNKLLAEYQMSALRAQMNPHFIFNCINSIQKFVLSNNSEEAYGYLQKFSRLIRLVLNYAEDNLITLEQELEIVELYLELEQLRFDEKFTYGISIASNVDKTDAMVPVMLMQPYIENAIWHGLTNLKDEKGHIQVNIGMENDLLTVLIEDNGIGMERSAELKKDGHKSRALDINSRRTEILNIMGSQTTGSVVIENITDESGNVTGTRVLLKIPQNTYGDE